MTKKRKNSLILLILSLAVSVSCFSCKKTESVAPQPPPVRKELPKSQIKPTQNQNSSVKKGGLPIQKQNSTARSLSGVTAFDFTNRKDPFKPYAQVTKSSEEKPVHSSVRKNTEDILPIQTFDSERFKVTGIIAGIKENRALLIDPNGKGYVVKEGMALGSNDGVVSKITANAVEIIEKFQDDNGKIRKRTVKLTLIRKK